MSFKVKALYDYNSGHDDDLGFSIGQIITVTDEEDADWYGGEYIDEAGTKREGIFPRNFVEKYEPTAPPRPTRTRTKKEPESAPAPVFEAAAPAVPSTEPPAPAASEVEEASEHETATPPSETSSTPLPAAAPAVAPPPPKLAQPVQALQAPAPPVPGPAPAPAAPAPQPAEVDSARSPPAPKAAPKPGPPPVSEKPASNSFKDRIAAFNKAAAPPVTPFKPSSLSSGGTGFIKKPFVAPPPSRNAYIPTAAQAPVAKIYRRDEDPEVKEQEAEATEIAGKAGLVPAAPTQEGEATEDQPKPMSLKERLALLQRQQMETAARHAEAAAKKEKPKRPPKKRLDSQASQDAVEGEAAERTEEASRTSTDEAPPPRVAHPPRRKSSSRGAEPRDGNEADMSGAGETTEGQEDLTEKDDSDARIKDVVTAPKQENSEQEEEEEEAEEEEEVDPEVRRREELRARMAKMSGGMGMPGMAMPLFGAPAPTLPKKKKAAPEKPVEEAQEAVSPTVRAPPVPLPGLMRPPPPPELRQVGPEEEEDEDNSRQQTPHQEYAPAEQEAAPPIPGGRPAPPPVPTGSRPPPPPPSASVVKSLSDGSVSDDELSERPNESDAPAPSTRAPPRPPPAVAAPPPIPARAPEESRTSFGGGISPTLPREPGPSKRDSRLPPPIPSFPPAPPPAQSRPPPPPPSAAPLLRRVSTDEPRSPSPVPVMRRHSEEGEEEVTEYEGDYDTDIASSVPHKDALKTHQRDSSVEEAMSPRSPTVEAPPPPPPVPMAAPPRAGPPPIPSQPPPEARRSTDVPRAAPPPPPTPKETARFDDEYDPYNYASTPHGPHAMPSYPMPTPSPHLRQEEPSFQDTSYGQTPRSPPPPPPPPGRAPPARQSVDLPRPSIGRRSMDVTRPSMETGFVANDIDLASQSGWWLQPSGLPPQLHGRKDIFFESEESSSADAHQGGKTIITRDICVLFQDYSQTVITVRFNPRDPADVHLEQQHKPPPRALRQDQLEESYERFGRAIGEAAASKKDTVVGDGTPQALIYELLRPFKDALVPVGTRAYGALVYSNLANASTTQNDEIRPGDIVSIRNAKFQGKHGAMHAKYSVEVGKPDHVGVVAEWDGTKKKVRAWEQGRESRKVKQESFKLDDLRSGEVKIWRVMPRSWIGWDAVGGGGSGGGGGGGVGGAGAGGVGGDGAGAGSGGN
ncbi:hypothetical protein N658DRAFT_104424 [Parathielavia hyrcaniae]|uniref:SH3 domain-containing protein n=1 Tax=Parathielavia hyrcaniae TaxID=113614 RepID=A0AAN6T149_9PEZI|nr:hypothetical protein N658DRAFT_104424 [Parathielavia hyrcaniae]